MMKNNYFAPSTPKNSPGTDEVIPQPVADDAEPSETPRRLWLGLSPAMWGVIVAIALGSLVYTWWPETTETPASLAATQNAPAVDNSLTLQPEASGATGMIGEEVARFKSDMATVLTTLGDRQKADSDALATLTHRLDSLEARLTEEQSQLATLQLHQTAAGTAASAPVNTEPSTPRPTHPAISRTAGYHINTLYTGMAWLSHNGQTYAVQEGDVLDGLRIVHISPEHREVETSGGIIH